jgi:quinol monooxygenase YgiN
VTAPPEVISGVALAGDLDPAGPRPMIAILDAKPDRAGELRRLVTELTEQVRREPGCLTFIAYERHGVDGRFYLYEIYRGLDAFRTHLGTEHVKHFVASIPELCANDTTAALVQLDEIPLDHY